MVAASCYRRLLIGGLLLALVGSLASACGGDDSEAKKFASNSLSSTTEQEIVPIIVSSELVVGDNRFVVGLLRNNQELLGAQVSLRFYKLDGDREILRSEVQTRPIRVTRTYVERHANGELHTHEAGETGVYVASAHFDNSGEWEVEVSAMLERVPLYVQRVHFKVLANGLTPALGAVPPPSRQAVLGDVGNDVYHVDTSNPPMPELHDLTIADALSSRKPTVISFASPGFCVSRICGPAKQVLDQLAPRYKNRVNFIHVEPYKLDEARAGKALTPIPTMAEWGLQTEPWTFVLDRQGRVMAKFQGLVMADEIDPLLQQALAAPIG